MKLLDYFPKYMELRRNDWSGATFQTYTETARNFGPVAEMELSDITIEDFYLLKNSLTARNMSLSIVRQTLGLLRNILSFAHAARRVANPPPDITALVKRSKDAKKVAEPEPFTLTELRAIIEACDPHYRNFFNVWMLTGCRPSELAALCWGDISFIDKVICVNKGFVKGKFAGGTKTGDIRYVPLTGECSDILKRMFLNAAAKEEDSVIEYHKVFTTSTGGPINGHTSRIFKTACDRAGVKHRRSYEIRHSYASNALAGGCSLPFISKVLGHANVLTTASKYLRPVADAIENEKQANKLEETLGGQTST